MKRIIGWAKIFRSGFICEYLKTRPFETRQNASIEFWPPRFNAITLVVDGRHSLLEFNRIIASNHYKDCEDGGVLTEADYFSYKLKQKALCTQMAIAADQYIEWVSEDSLPASRWNDIKQMKANLESFKKNLDERDITCFDGGYQSIDREVSSLLPHRKKKGVPLSLGQDQENDEIAEFRGDVERVFGRLATKFDFLTVAYRHGDAEFNGDFKLACALLNCELKGKADNLRNMHRCFREEIFDFNVEESSSEEEELVVRLYGNRFSATLRQGI